MNLLRRVLGETFSLKGAKARPKTDPDYHKFRALLKEAGLTYKIDPSDNYIVLSDQRAFPHYGDWSETLAHYLESQA